LYLHNIRERNVRILDGDTVPNTFSPSTTKPAKATRCDIVQNCNINNAHSLYGGPAWYDTISATSLRDTFVHTLTTKGFKSTQTSVIMKNKQTCSFDFDEQDSRLGWNLGKNGKMIVGGRKNENYCALGIGSMMMGSFMNNQAYFYLFVHLNDQEFACEGGDSCCGAGTICGEGEGDCDSDSDCTSGTKCGEDNCKAVHFGSTFGIWNADDDCCEGPCHTDRACDENGINYYGSEYNLVELKRKSLEECSCACQKKQRL